MLTVFPCGRADDSSFLARRAQFEKNGFVHRAPKNHFRWSECTVGSLRRIALTILFAIVLVVALNLGMGTLASWKTNYSLNEMD